MLTSYWNHWATQASYPEEVGMSLFTTTAMTTLIVNLKLLFQQNTQINFHTDTQRWISLPPTRECVCRLDPCPLCLEPEKGQTGLIGSSSVVLKSDNNSNKLTGKNHWASYTRASYPIEEVGMILFVTMMTRLDNTLGSSSRRPITSNVCCLILAVCM
jgi:hypothetical protein